MMIDMKTRRFLLLVMGSCLGLWAQETAVVMVGGNVKQPLTLSAADLAKMPRATVETQHDGHTMHYEGVWLDEILKRAGAPNGAELRGKALASYVLVQAKDGYQVVYSLGELDPALGANQVLLADKAEGQPLPPNQGIFRLVAPKDKRAARSVRMVTRIEVVQLNK